jgi:hypothetical protein
VTDRKRNSKIVREGGGDIDDIAGRLVAAGWKVLRARPGGVAGRRAR